MHVEKKGENLVITLALKKEPKLSEQRKRADGKISGGNNFVLASTGGFVGTNLDHNGEVIRVNVVAIAAA